MSVCAAVCMIALWLIPEWPDVLGARADTEREREDFPCARVASQWMSGDLASRSGSPFHAISEIVDHLNILVPIALKDDPADPRKASRMCEALELAARLRIQDAIPVIVPRLRVRPHAGWVVSGNMGELDAYPFAYSLATIGRDSVPHIISHLRNKRDDIDAVPEEDIQIFAHVLDHIYLKSLDPECIAVLELYPDAVHVQRLLHAYRQLK
jgi:hypothetical protein